jgi:hypothetical protein
LSSPYESALDLTGLHPRLRAYFGEIPAGSVGRGRGVFGVVGTPRRWLWPVLWILGRQSVVFAAWARDVPFTVVNRPAAGALHGARTFHFARGDRTMVDLMRADDALVDVLGNRGQYRAVLSGEVRGGQLTLRSTSMRTRRLGIRLPGSVEVTERWDDASHRQHVAVVISAPLIGRVYEYSGFFTYDIEADHVLAP